MNSNMIKTKTLMNSNLTMLRQTLIIKTKMHLKENLQMKMKNLYKIVPKKCHFNVTKRIKSLLNNSNNKVENQWVQSKIVRIIM